MNVSNGAQRTSGVQRLRVLATGCLLEVRLQGLNCPSSIQADGADVVLASFCSLCRSRTDQGIHWRITRQNEFGTTGQSFIDGDSSGAASRRREIAVMIAQPPDTLINRSIHNHPPVAGLLLTLLEGVSPLN
ncbi:MAG: hypothetical protein Q7T10_18250 [Rhodoferax sp.]|uniref:hypothetical protein n=1 Tax=Rhodoferax sp. TaxID=50421 RepID=UPI00271DD679|nr:hypothetical protein [Rhodoferax sp.]MDO8450737.1 hypothetical protein [Rhodoferax sp.]